MIKSTRGVINYIADMPVRPQYYSTDISQNVIELEPVEMDITNARALEQLPALDTEGFQLIPHASQVKDFTNMQDDAEIYNDEIKAILLKMTGADEVVITSPGIVRYSEKSKLSGEQDNSHPARFVHIDMTPETAVKFSEGVRPASCPSGRVASYNVWRVISPAPQDVPLAICTAQTLKKEDLVNAEAIFDPNGVTIFSFDSYVVRPNEKHQWMYFHDMNCDEALVFKAYDSDPNSPCNVAHVAFTDNTCPENAEPRASIEMRATAYWRD